MRFRHLPIIPAIVLNVALDLVAAPVPQQQFFDDFETPAQLEHWKAWSNQHEVTMELASPGYESDTCLRLTVPAQDWDTPILEFPTPIRVTERTVLRFRMRAVPGMIEGINVRNATEDAEYLLSFPLPGKDWMIVQRYLKSAVYKRFGKPDVPKDGVIGDTVSSIQIAYMGTELALDDVEVFEARTDLPELPPDDLLPVGSYQLRSYPILGRVFPFGVISTVAAGNGANAAIFGQTSDERFEDDLLDLKRHGMNAISNFCDDTRVAWRLDLMAKYRMYLVETALANTDLRGAKTGDPGLKLITDNRDNPRLLAWYGRDEPQDCLAYLDNKRVVDAADPDHPLASAFSQMPVAKLLGPYMELMMLDPYSVFKPERSIEALVFHADLVRNAKQYCQNRKVWLIPQAFSWRRGTTTTMRMPDPAEARFDVFNAIGAGTNGFLFFIYNDACTYLDGALRGEEFDDTLVDPWGNPHPTYEALSDLARVLVPTMPALLDAVEPVEAQIAVEYAADTLVLGRLRNANGDYLVFTNKDLAEPYQGTVRVTQTPGQGLYDLLTLRGAGGGGGAAVLDLSPGGGAVLMVASPESWDAVRRGVLSRRLEQERELLIVELEVLKAQGLGVRRIEDALLRAEEPRDAAAALGAVRAMLAGARQGSAEYATMATQLAQAQRGFGEIQALIRPVVATVDGTTDNEWLTCLDQLRDLSVTYFRLKREFRSGNVSHGPTVSALLQGQRELQADIARLVRR